MKSPAIDFKLREFAATDAERMAQLADNHLVARNLRDGFPSPYTLEHAHAWLELVSKKNGNMIRVIEIDGQFAGSIGLHTGQDVYRFNYEIGYWLGEPYWRKGIMTAATKEMIRIGFAELPAHRIFAGIFAFNNASARVLMKCGFKHEATLKQSVFKNNEWTDELVFSLLKTDFLKQLQS